MIDVSPGVSIDLAHADLVGGLVAALKPASVLEFGYGGGRSVSVILAALHRNGIAARYLLVDNWADWSGERPAEAYREGVQFVTQAEGDFVAACGEQFEFIMSDADHLNAQRWHRRVYDDLLAPGGILIYHDVLNFPDLFEIVDDCRARGLSHVLFNRNSLPGEACGRGLLVVFKAQEG